MLDFSSLIQIIADVVMIFGGAFVFIQNYSYWKKYRLSDSIYWFVAGALVVFLGSWVLATRFFLPADINDNTAAFLSLSRRALFVLVAVYLIAIACWEYWLKERD